MAKKAFAGGSGGGGMMLWLGIAAIIILIDQVTKVMVMRTFSFKEAKPITSFFNLIYTVNPGAAFSLLADAGGYQRWLFMGIGIAAAIFIIYLLRKHAGQRLFCWALTLILGGAIGNVIDRVLYGHVIDFLDFHAGGWHWPAFNVADMAICLGAVLFVVDELRRVNR